LKKTKEFIPVSQPVFNGNEKKYILEALDTGWISSEGPFVSKFEEEFSKKVNRQYGIAVSSGTAALDIAVKALDIGVGDEVIMPTFTIISCAASVVKRGAIPIFIDVDPITWNMNVSQIEEKITNRTKAIMAVHIYGLPVDIDPLIDLANQYKLLVIEDAAEMHGQTYKNRLCGSFGHISTFSFYANKNITTGEGGMIVTNSKSLRDRCRSLRNLCLQDKKRFIHSELGWNYRLTNIQAAIGLAQLERLEEIVEKKRRIGRWYNNLLNNLEGISLPLENTDYANNIYWVYGIVINKDNLNVEDLINLLKIEGIGSRPFFYPLHLQPVLVDYKKFNNTKFPVSEKISKQGLYLPSGLGISHTEIKKVANVLRDIVGE